MGVLDSFPDRPLRRAEVESLGENDRVDGIFPIYGDRPGEHDNAHGLVIKLGEKAIAAAYDDPWERLETREVSAGEGIAWDEQEVLSKLQDVIIDQIGESGAGSREQFENRQGDDSESEQPWEVEQGLEPGYNCPDCEYSKSGLTVSPHDFLDHLQNKHGYSQSEAFDIMNG